MRKIAHQQKQFTEQLSHSLQLCYQKVAVGVNGTIYAPRIVVITQADGDHIPNFASLNNRYNGDGPGKVYIPRPIGIDVVEKANKRLLGIESTHLRHLQEAYPNLEFEYCGKEIIYDDVTIEIYPLYETEPPEIGEEALGMRVHRNHKSAPISIEVNSREGYSFTYIGEGESDALVKTLLEGTDDGGWVVLTPLHPNIPDSLVNEFMKLSERTDEASKQRCMDIRQDVTRDYRFVKLNIKNIIDEVTLNRGVDYMTALEACHAEGVLKKPQLPTVSQNVENLSGVMFPGYPTGVHYLAHYLNLHFT